MIKKSRELPGLTATVSRVVHVAPGDKIATDKPHAFVYFIAVRNGSDETVTLLGRKWVVHENGGRRTVIEGDGIVGRQPRLRPGGHFSYNSFHTTEGDARAEGSFHGVDASGRPIHVRIPPFEMIVPPEETA